MGAVDSERVYIGGGIPLATTVRATTTLPITPVPVPQGSDRGLTAGEEAMARTVFGDGVDYKSIRINHHGYGVLLGFQKQDTAMTPNGSMYMPHPIYRDDYSQGDDADKRLFMHEMVHVWQWQMGYPVKRKGLTVTIRGDSAYAYTLTPTSQLCDFNMEQQGNLMSDYYMICIYGHPHGAYNPGMHPVWLRRVMLPFENPRDPEHLPHKSL
jgi:type VI secretion system secreted protein VgrG